MQALCKNTRKHQLLVILVLIVWALTGTALAGSMTNHAQKRLTVEQKNAPLPLAHVTIQKKSIESVTTNIGDRYRVNTDTIIVNTDGQQVSIRQMLVPCEALVSYSTAKGIRKAERIAIKHVGATATWQWSTRLPE